MFREKPPNYYLNQTRTQVTKTGQRISPSNILDHDLPIRDLGSPGLSKHQKAELWLDDIVDITFLMNPAPSSNSITSTLTGVSEVNQRDETNEKGYIHCAINFSDWIGQLKVEKCNALMKVCLNLTQQLRLCHAGFRPTRHRYWYLYAVLKGWDIRKQLKI